MLREHMSVDLYKLEKITLEQLARAISGEDGEKYPQVLKQHIEQLISHAQECKLKDVKKVRSIPHDLVQEEIDSYGDDGSYEGKSTLPLASAIAYLGEEKKEIPACMQSTSDVLRINDLIAENESLKVENVRLKDKLENLTAEEEKPAQSALIGALAYLLARDAGDKYDKNTGTAKPLSPNAKRIFSETLELHSRLSPKFALLHPRGLGDTSVTDAIGKGDSAYKSLLEL